MQYSYHEFGILEFSAAGTVLPAPLPELGGGGLVGGGEEERARMGRGEEGWGGGGGPVLKNTLPALAVYISLARLWLFPWRRE